MWLPKRCLPPFEASLIYTFRANSVYDVFNECVDCVHTATLSVRRCTRSSYACVQLEARPSAAGRLTLRLRLRQLQTVSGEVHHVQLRYVRHACEYRPARILAVMWWSKEEHTEHTPCVHVHLLLAGQTCQQICRHSLHTVQCKIYNHIAIDFKTIYRSEADVGRKCKI